MSVGVPATSTDCGCCPLPFPSALPLPSLVAVFVSLGACSPSITSMFFAVILAYL